VWNGSFIYQSIKTHNPSIIYLHSKQIKTMRSILYIIAVILVIGWLIGAFAYSTSGIIHVLLVLAVISFLVGLIRKGKI
jgi:uncharacterized membrane protein YkgB